MGLYIAIPKVSHELLEIATGVDTLKTLLQVAVPSAKDIRVWAWGVSGDGQSSTAAPGMVTLMETDVGITSATSLTPELWESDSLPVSYCVGGTGATAYWDADTAEGTITASRILDPQNVHPQTGYSLWFPEGARPRVGASKFLRVRTRFAATVNLIPWVIWAEPA